MNKQIAKYAAHIKDDLFLHPYGDHGVGHTKRVLYLANCLSNHFQLSEENNKLLSLACCYHDIGRIHDFTDDYHGMLSAEKFTALGLHELHELTQEQTEIILKLIIHHSLDDSTCPFTADEYIFMYKILKDADAIDRLRFDDLDTKYLRFDYSHELIATERHLLDHWKEIFSNI